MSSKEEDNRKWWIISPYVPECKEKPTKDDIKWLVEGCYKDKDYEFYEWDFKSHCIKTD